MSNNITNINSKYIIRFIIKEYLRRKLYFNLFRHNKKIQEILEINLKSYQEYYNRRLNRTEMEIIPIEKIEPDISYLFIKSRENKNYYHIYFDNDFNTQIKRNYITYKDKIKKITIKIDMELKSLRGLFRECTAIKEFKFTKFNRDDFTDIQDLFYGCINLEKIDLQIFKSKNLTNMNYLFSRCSSLHELNISNLDTSKVSEMVCLFSGCYLLKKLKFNFKTQNVTNMKGMFYKCKSLKEIDVVNFNTKNVMDFSEMFFECVNLIHLNLNNFDIFKEKINISKMLGGCRRSLRENITKQFNKTKDKDTADRFGKFIDNFKFEDF